MKKWTQEEQDQLAEKLKRTLDDKVVDELMDSYYQFDLLEQIANAHEAWEVWRDEMAAARYQDEVKIIPALREQVEKLTELLKHIDECISYCPHCDGSGYFPRGPYQDECPTCLGYAHTVSNPRGLLAAAVDVFLLLHPDKPVVTELHDPYDEE
jgi:hypothetical protein